MAKAVDRAYNLIRAQILDGTLAAGTRLKEEELAETIGVSRTPVREALRRLSAEQLVSFSPNHGTHVSAWSEGDVAEIFALRGMLESYAAERAAIHRGEAEMAQILACQAEIERAAQAIPPDLQRLTHANHQFHRLLLQAAQSERLRIMVSWLIDMPVMLKTFAIYSPAERERSLDHHRELIEALKARDGEWARAVMQNHVSAARNVYFRALKDAAKVDLAIAARTRVRGLQEATAAPGLRRRRSNG